MNVNDPRFREFHLVREMLETPGLIRDFDPEGARSLGESAAQTGTLLLTGEGSSRIFPAGNVRRLALASGLPLRIEREGARQAMEYNLADWTVAGASNSGRTRELIELMERLGQQGHRRRFGVTANSGSPLEKHTDHCHVLACGEERAVAATKSVIEQVLYDQAALRYAGGPELSADHLAHLAEAADQVLQQDLEPELIARLQEAEVIYFAGRDDGVAEELTLKTNEIARKRSDFLEGTYAVHGVEEVMNPTDALVLVDPWPELIDTFVNVLGNGVGIQLVAISSHRLPIPTLPVPEVPASPTIPPLLAGWNLLVHVGVAGGVDLDKPERARKIGNEI